MPACNAEEVKVFSNAEVRAWARDNGYEVADRGRIPVAVVAAYEAAHQEASVSDDFVSDVYEPDDDPAAADSDPYEADPAEPDQARSVTGGSDSYRSREPRTQWTPTWAPPTPPAAPPAYAPPQWGAPAPGASWGQQAPPPGREGFSIASLVLGIIPVFGGILAIAFGIVAMRRIRRSHQDGRGMAIVGIVLGTGWMLLFGALIAVALTSGPDRGTDGSVVTGGSVTSNGLRVGDCASSIPSGEVITVDLVPCAKPHRAEVYGDFALAGADFPGKPEVLRFADGGCTDRLIAYVGRARADGFEIHYVIPTAEGWDQGRRRVRCFLAAPDGGMLPGGSAKTP